MSKDQFNLSSALKKLEDITAWFDAQEEVDVEKGLEKVEEGAALIKESKRRLKGLENRFIEIKRDVENESAADMV